MAGMFGDDASGVTTTASNRAFKQNLNKVYTWYIGGFIIFVVALAILEQMGLSRAWIGYIFLLATIGLYAGIGFIFLIATVLLYGGIGVMSPPTMLPNTMSRVAACRPSTTAWPPAPTGCPRPPSSAWPVPCT